MSLSKVSCRARQIEQESRMAGIPYAGCVFYPCLFHEIRGTRFDEATASLTQDLADVVEFTCEWPRNAVNCSETTPDLAPRKPSMLLMHFSRGRKFQPDCISLRDNIQFLLGASEAWGRC